MCADERPFWVGGKPFVSRKKGDREKPIGSGRLTNNNPEQRQPLSAFRYPNPYHEKTGREFYERGRPAYPPKSSKDWNVNYFNPLNRDHRRLTSRLDTIELHSFQDDQIDDIQHYIIIVRKVEVLPLKCLISRTMLKIRRIETSMITNHLLLTNS